MARLPRFFAPGFPLHVIQRGNNRSLMFRAERDCVRFLEVLAEASGRFGLETHAYQLMSNHVHLLVTPRDRDSLPRAMQSIGRCYVAWFNARYRRTGTLCEGRYRSTIVDTQAYLLTCMRYIEDNARRAGMVRHPADHPWSSYGANALGMADHLVTPHPVYLAIARDETARRTAYTRLFKTVLTDGELQAIREATNGGWALGGPAFQKTVETLTGRRAAPFSRPKSFVKVPISGEDGEAGSGMF